ncbi:hypothetical protein ACRPNP_10335 [Levilactobacillus brevis]|uniref:hypothetical protein n=1 Tax=Levilactobacillus brevis TaxID=1580 RepID=UPI003D789237
MATPNVGILTTAGKALIDKVNSGQAKISFSKIVFSSMDNSQLSDMQVKALTAIAPQEVVVSSPETTLDTNSGETRIRATGTNEKLADGVYVKTYGVFAKDDTGSEILYGVTVSPNPNYFPAYDGVTPQAVTYSYKTVIQETSNITMTNSNDVYASQEDLAEALQPYAKTVDVNQQLDKKVNIADMRKPASDVAGIEEVNAKADASAVDQLKTNLTNQVSTLQTQVDNSAVGTNLLTNSNFSSGLGNFTVNSGTNSDCKAVVTTDSDGDTCVHITGTGAYCGLYCRPVSFNQNQVTTGSTLVKGTGKCNLVGLPNRPGSNFGTISTESYSKVGTTVQAASGTNAFCAYFDPVNGVVDIYIKFAKLELSSHATDWCPNPLEILTKADDSKVAHLSGANNFDTVPTVNNNPLLLASSLPSDLARTGSDQEFTGKNTFDTAPIDKTTGNPYITKDGVPAVPSTLADTTKDANFTGKLQKSGIDVATTTDVTNAVSTATANMVDSTKATNFTAGLQSGGVDVATAADLNNYYHANASDSAALAAAKAAKVPGIFWFEEV